MHHLPSTDHKIQMNIIPMTAAHSQIVMFQASQEKVDIDNYKYKRTPKPNEGKSS